MVYYLIEKYSPPGPGSFPIYEVVAEAKTKKALKKIVDRKGMPVGNLLIAQSLDMKVLT